MDSNPTMYSFGESMNFQSLGGDSNLLGLSLQDMIESDIKQEFDDISSLSSFANMDTLNLLSDINFKLEDGFLDSDHPVSMANTTWGSGLGVQSCNSICDSALNGTHASSNSYLEEISGATGLMVNPNNVMPVSHHPYQQEQPIQFRNKQLSISTSQFSNSQSLSNSSPRSHLSNAPIIMSQAHFNGMLTASSTSGGIKTLKILPPMSSPMQQVPSPTVPSHSFQKKKAVNIQIKDSGFPKPAYSYSCLISLALRNSFTGSMSVSEIYKFMCEHFPYFKTAPSGWKNSVRHNLSLNKCFEKIEKPNPSGNQRKGCLWAMNPAKITKMEEEVAKWSRKDPVGVKKGMVHPEHLEMLERGEMKKDYGASPIEVESEDDEDPRTPASVSSQSSQGDDQQGFDFVDVEGFTHIPDSSLPELNLQVSGGMFEELDSTNGSLCHGNYSIKTVVHSDGDQKPYNMLVIHKQKGKEVFGI